MKMMKRHAIIFFLMLAVLALRAQNTSYFELVKGETELTALFEQLYSDSVQMPEVVLERIQKMMPAILSLPGGMEYPWSKLDRIGVITSKDGRVRIFTWHWMDDPDNFRYFGYMQVEQKRGKFEVFPLKDNGLPQERLFKLRQSTEDWYGKLYYGIVTHDVKRRTFYTLLGMDFNNSRSNLKMVEMMEIRRNRPQFAEKGFSNGKDLVDRVVLEYSDQVAITARYDPVQDMIVYDHLVPLHAVYENNYEFYGPDGSFDGLKFMDGMWVRQEDVDVRMPN